MGLTTALYTSLSGLSANSQLISVTGNNIANVNTTAFKSSRADFQAQIVETLRQGSGPSANLGGTNPVQVGLGTKIGSISRNFNGGSLQATGVNTDLAIEGKGFFVVQSGGVQYYTRAGGFKLDRDSNLVNGAGALLQGYGIDGDFNIIEGVQTKLTIPLGAMTLAQQTDNVRFAGNLNAEGLVATNASIINSETLHSDPGATTPAVATDALTSLYRADGSSVFSLGDVITMTGASRGGATLPERTFEVGPANTTGSDANGTTLQDYLTFLEDILGIDTGVSGGVSTSAGQLVIEGNTGAVNDLILNSGNIILNRSTNPSLPLAMTKAQAADGESVRTTFVVFDSLGSALTVDLNIVLEDKNNTGTVWRFYAQSEEDSDLSRLLGNGTITFGTDGQFISVSDNQIRIDRAGTGAAPIQTISLNFNQGNQGLSALADSTSQITALSQDGFAIGTLEDFTIAEDGTIIGIFSNSQLRTLGSVMLANFVNPGGLKEVGGGLFSATAASGDATLITPGSAGAGVVVGGALELSNVDLSNEFINLITATTGYSASSRVLTTSDRLIQELLAAVR